MNIHLSSTITSGLRVGVNTVSFLGWLLSACTISWENGMKNFLSGLVNILFTIYIANTPRPCTDPPNFLLVK